MTWLRPLRAHGREGTNTIPGAPQWPNGDRSGALRVLVEHAEPATRHSIARGLQAHGYEVVECGGPDADGPDPVGHCPVLSNEACPAVNGADVIVSGFNVGAEREGLIVRRIAESPGSPPMLVEATDWQVEALFGNSDALRHGYPFSSIDQIITAIEGMHEPVL